LEAIVVEAALSHSKAVEAIEIEVCEDDNDGEYKGEDE
jgi:hypothetical protein